MYGHALRPSAAAWRGRRHDPSPRSESSGSGRVAYLGAGCLARGGFSGSGRVAYLGAGLSPSAAPGLHLPRIRAFTFRVYVTGLPGVVFVACAPPDSRCEPHSRPTYAPHDCHGTRCRTRAPNGPVDAPRARVRTMGWRPGKRGGYAASRSAARARRSAARAAPWGPGGAGDTSVRLAGLRLRWSTGRGASRTRRASSRCAGTGPGRLPSSSRSRACGRRAWPRTGASPRARRRRPSARRCS